MLPEGWKRLHVSDLVSQVEAGVSVNGEDRPICFGEVGVLKVSCVSSGVFLPSQHKAIIKAEIPRAKTSPKAGRIIVSRSNTETLVGASAYVPADHPELYLSDKLWQLEPVDHQRINMRWLAYWLATDQTRDTLTKLGTGTSGSMKNISKEELLGLNVPTPPVEEQEAIAKIIGIWDRAIGAIEELLSNSLQQKRALINKILMPVPTPDRKRISCDAYPPSVQPGLPQLPPTPQGWRKTSLSQHLREVVRPAKLEANRSYRLVTVRRSRGGVDERGILLGSEIKTPTQFYVKAGDFLISKRQIVHGACGLVPPELDGAIVSNEYAVLNTTDDLDSRFLRYLSETTYFQQTCFHSSIGVHIEKMLFRLDKWLKWPVNLPPLAEQKRIVALLDVASEQEAALRRQLDLLKKEKRALMHDLLTGKRRVRLPDPEAAAIPA